MLYSGLHHDCTTLSRLFHELSKETRGTDHRHAATSNVLVFRT